MSFRAALLFLALIVFGSCVSGGARPLHPGDPAIPGEKRPTDPVRNPRPPGDHREPSLLLPPVGPVRFPPVQAENVPADRPLSPADHDEPPLFETLARPLVRFVDAPGGLNLRAVPNVRGHLLAVLSHRAAIKVVGRLFEARVLAGRTGRWVQVETDAHRGWVFDAFLSREAPPVPEDDFRALFTGTSFRSRLVAVESDGERYLGGFTKTAGSVTFRVATLTRLCGQGEADKALQFTFDRAAFALGYRWCSVDPGDIVHTQCVQCNLVRYRCEISVAELRAGRTAAGLYEKPIVCVQDAASYCARECDTISPLRDAETPR